VTDHATLRLHTGELYLTNVVTSEGNWLHQILCRGFIAKGVNTFTFTFKSFSRRSYPERLTNWCIHLMTSSGTVTFTIVHLNLKGGG
jgi:hypothetical protein